MPGPGPLNAITDVPGILVGQAQDLDLMTGVTVVVPEAPTVAALDVRGGAPGTRETDFLRPESTLEHIHAVALSGGSAFGLDAAGGAADWLRRQGRGLPFGGHLVPIVPSAILFDLGRGAVWDTPPWWRMGAEAAASAARTFGLGCVGAGTGAHSGGLKGGVGTASIVSDGFVVGAIAVANSLGSVVMPGTRSFWAWWLEEAGEFGGQLPPAAAPDTSVPLLPREVFGNTTLVVVATDAALNKGDAGRIAMMAQDGLARAIRPVHTPLDGDIVFALATGQTPLRDRVPDLARIGSHAADCVARAITRGVVEAVSLGGTPAWRDG
ncbi:MAG TPA: P1 family peptidase [Thermohalobaculum sp.]|nr:P1 family peptidase [Thermohalobaculum sp.]